MTSLYADAGLPIRPGLEAVHRATLASFAEPGSWYSGAERCALVAEARRARYATGLQEDGLDHTVDAELSPTARRVAGQVATFVADLERGFLDDALADGLTREQYVEIVGVVARAANLDIFARGIGEYRKNKPPFRVLAAGSLA